MGCSASLFGTAGKEKAREYKETAKDVLDQDGDGQLTMQDVAIVAGKAKEQVQAVVALATGAQEPPAQEETAAEPADVDVMIDATEDGGSPHQTPGKKRSTRRKAKSKAKRRTASQAVPEAAPQQMSFDDTFIKRFAPNGQTWRDYCGAVPPAQNQEGQLIGVWGECLNSAVIFEVTDGSYPATREVIEFAEQCGYGEFLHLLQEAEGWMREEIEAAQEDTHAFMRHVTPYGITWAHYCEKVEPKLDANGYVNGTWGQCITAAVIFEHQNPNWSQLPAYQADGPAGQVIMFLEQCGHEPFSEALLTTERATHDAIEQNGKLPVFKEVYQPVIELEPAPEVAEDEHAGPEMTGVKKAFVVGCNYPGQPAALRGCVNDTHSWKDTLMKHYGFEEKNILVMHDELEDKRLWPTLKNMKNGLRWLAEGANPGDVLFFSFSGHGTQIDSDDGNEADGKDEALCPTNFREEGLLLDNEIFDLVVTPLVSGVKLTIILDCCHSGTAVDLSFIWEMDNDSWEEVGGTRYVAGDVQMFSGCQDDQCSMDVAGVFGRPQGAMTMAMTKVVENDNSLPYPELLTRLHEALEEGGYDQKPRLTSSQKFGAGSKSFSLCEGAIPNLNEHLGFTGPPRVHDTRTAAAELDAFLWE
mmetsp:Transcript_15263/g.26720  ORF Transcript_15263/g.26720 Transcript_15263/m.26720 type:complete len:641 (+) Transcript_15263:60-1982(+)